MKKRKTDQQGKEILKYLARGRASTSEIAGFCGFNYYQALTRLSDLQKEKKVKVLDTGKSKYWELVKC